MRLRIRELRKTENWTQADLADATGLSRPYIAAIESGNIKKSPSVETLDKLASAFQIPVPSLFESSEVPLIGFVGAGSEIDLRSADELSEFVEAPINAKKDTKALRITGDSNFPVYEDGEILYYSENLPPETAMNRRCVVKLRDGRIFVKVLRPGLDGRYNLESMNPLYPTIENVEIEWVARIDWIKPKS